MNQVHITPEGPTTQRLDLIPSQDFGILLDFKEYLSISNVIKIFINTVAISFLEHVSKIHKLNVRNFTENFMFYRELSLDFGILDFRIATFVRILTGI